MNEATKLRQYLGEAKAKEYFGKSVLDIGAGNDPIVPWARVFDKKRWGR